MDRSEARRALEIPETSVAVAWVGRHTREKDPVTFARAMSDVSLNDDVLGLLAGAGPLLADVRAAAPVGRVRVLGWVDDPAELLAAADIFVNTSRWEGLPLSVLEAASTGLPLVLTDVPGNRDLSELGVPALLVPAASPSALAAAIAGLAADPRRRAEMGQEAARIVRAMFTPAGLAEDVLAVYVGVA
jgi:glycosyltransferase involved in cell wall biosynthesis